MEIDIPIEPEKKKRGRDVESDDEEIAVPRKRVGVVKKKYDQEQRNSYDDKTIVPNIMLMSKEERVNIIATTENPFGYPKEYLDLYKRERSRRNLRGYENLLDVTETKIFTNEVDQIPGKMLIKNHRNINCIKSREDYDNSFIDNIEFSSDSYILFQSLGLNYIRSLSDFIDLRMRSDNDFIVEYKNAINQFYQDTFGKPKQECSFTEKDYHKENEIEVYFRDFYTEKIWKPEYKQIERNRNCDIYDCIIAVIKNILGEYSNYVVIAGGFSLSMYIYKNYGYHIGFKDIDMFIHSCSNEIKDIIIEKFKTHFYTMYNENVICFLLCSMVVDSETSLIFTKETFNNIQIIRRLYSCPQEVITGFDTDCCCILTNMEGRIWVTERGHYSIKNGYNVFNFERMSPSYEYRALKYRNRGFGIWIPFMDYFRDNAFFDFTLMEKQRGSTIFLKHMAKLIDDSKIEKKSSDDYSNGKLINLNYGKTLEFKTLNPNEQTINTFHRVFLDDPKAWYPERPKDAKEYINVTVCSDQLREINEFININNITTRNIIRRYNNDIKQYEDCSKRSYNIISFLYEIDNDIILHEDIVKNVIFGKNSNFITIEERDGINKEKISFLFKLYIQLIKYSSYIMRELGINIEVKGLQSLMEYRYMYHSYDEELGMVTTEIDITNEESYIKYNECKIHGILSFDEYRHYMTLDKIEEECIYIILPEQFSKVHYELLVKTEYNLYRGIIAKKNWKKIKLLVSEYRKTIRRSLKTKEITLSEYREKVKIAHLSIREQVERENQTLPYDRWTLPSRGLSTKIKFDAVYNISYFKSNKNKKSYYQFKGGKIYGSEYNIVMDKFNLRDCTILEYPVIDNFVAKI